MCTLTGHAERLRREWLHWVFDRHSAVAVIESYKLQSRPVQRRTVSRSDIEIAAGVGASMRSQCLLSLVDISTDHGNITDQICSIT